MAEIMQGGEMFKQVDAREGRQPVYIHVASCSQGDQIIIAKKGDAFLQVGMIGYRDPDNPKDWTRAETHKTYIKVSKDQVNPKSLLSEGETELFEDIAVILARKFKQYIDEASGI